MKERRRNVKKIARVVKDVTKNIKAPYARVAGKKMEIVVVDVYQVSRILPPFLNIYYLQPSMKF